jgi:hypothetical protein
MREVENLIGHLLVFIKCLDKLFKGFSERLKEKL